nr:recombinase family protein [Subtercola sp. Z020]
MTIRRIGYGRVSTSDQNLRAQHDALAMAEVDKLFVEKASGTKASRPEWDRCRDALRHGDTLVVTRLDRLGRSAKDLLAVADWLKEEGVVLEVIEQRIDTATIEGRLFFTMVSAFAEFEREMMVSRTKDGLAAARARGRTGGRKPKMTPARIAEAKKLYASGEHTVQQIADLFSVSRPTIYRALGVLGHDVGDSRGLI